MKAHLFSLSLVLLLVLSVLPGSSASEALPSTISQYNWQQGSSLPQPSGDGALFMLGSKLFYAGGWAVDPSQPLAATYAASVSDRVPSTWNPVGALPGDARFGAGLTSQNSRAYLLGGNNGATTLDRIDSFDGANWRAERPLPRALNFPGVAILGNRLHVAGGLPGPGKSAWSAVINSDGSLQGWQAEADLPIALITRLAGWNSCLYAIGGKDSGGWRHAEIYRGSLYADGTVGAWTNLTNLPESLAFHAVAIRQGVLHIIAGERADGTISNLVYSARIAADCSLSAWSSMYLPNGIARQRVAAATSDYGLYIAGGLTSSGSFFQDTWYHVIPHVSLALSSEPISPVQEGDQVRYVVDYALTGQGIAESVLITNAVPAKSKLVAGSISPPELGSETNGVVSWYLGNQNSPQRRSLEYRTRVACTQGIVTGLVFDDRDGSGVRDGVEAGRGGVTVHLLRQDAVLRSTVTDGSGVYTFYNVPLGSYQIEPVLPVGSLTTTSSRVPVTVADSGNCRFGASFGLRYCSRLATTIDPPDSGQIFNQPAPNCQGGTAGQALYNPGTIVVLTVHSELGYRFSGWSGDAGVTSSLPLSISMDRDKTLTATLGIDCSPLAISLAVPGGGSVSAVPLPNCPSAAGLYLNGTAVTLNATPSTGYAFQYWSGAATGSSRTVQVVVDREITVGANFAACYPLLTEINTTGSGRVSANPGPNCQGGGTSLYDPGTQVRLNAMPSADYAFESWSGSLIGQANPITVTMDSGKTITAKFESCVDASTIADPKSAGSAGVTTQPNCPGGSINLYKPNSSVAITTETNSDYFSFKQWRSSAGVIVPNQLPSARWDLSDTNGVAIAEYDSCKTLTLSVYREGWGSIERLTPYDCGPVGYRDAYKPGTTVVLEAIPYEGHHWIGWNGDVVGTSSTVGVVMDGDKSVAALFDVNCYSLATSVQPSGAGQIQLGTQPNCVQNPQQYLHGTTITLTATAAPAHKFMAWEGDASGPVTHTVITMDRQRAVTARFSPCYALNTTLNPADYGTVRAEPGPNCDGGGANYYNPDTAVQLTASPALNRAFYQWSGGASGTLNVTGVIMNSSKTAVANFRSCLNVSTANLPPDGGLSVVGTPPNCPGGGDTYAPLSRIILSSIASPYYVFDHWETTGGIISSPTAPNAVLTLGTTDVSATSIFGTCQRLNVTVSRAGWGTVNASPTPNCGADRYLPGTKVALTANPATGKAFKQWGGSVQGTEDAITVTLNSDLAINAEFEIACRSLSTVPLPSASAGSISLSPAPNCARHNGQYEYGTVVTARAVPAQGYAFADWTGSLRGPQNPVTVTLTTGLSLVAHFAACHPLSIKVTPTLAGAVAARPLPNCQGGGSDLYNPGNDVELLAIPADNYRFSHWTGNASGTNNPVSLVISRALSITAVFSGTGSLPSLTPDPVRWSGASQGQATAPSATWLAPQGFVVLNNQGAYANWVFDGISFWSKSGPQANRLRLFLPLLVR